MPDASAASKALFAAGVGAVVVGRKLARRRDRDRPALEAGHE